MGAECPNGHGRQPVVSNITADGSTPKTSDDVIAHKLGCGCIVGGSEYQKFQEQVVRVKQEEAEAIAAIRKQTKGKLGDAYQVYLVKESE